jgi:predicted MFS family arabinose efflux permease
MLAAFMLIEARLAEHPLVPLGVFRRRSLTAANGVSFVIGASIFSLFFFLSLYLQQVNGYSPLRAGLAFLPVGLAILAAALLAARLVARIGARRQLIAGLLLTAVGLAWLTRLAPGDSYWSAMFGPALLAGAGFGLSFVPMTIGATAGVPPQQAGLASGLVNTTRQVGGAIGLAVAATVAGAVRPQSAAPHAVASALTSGYDRAFGISAAVLVAGALIALLLPGRLGVAQRLAPAGGDDAPVPAAASGR